jgi:hypothetical protein
MILISLIILFIAKMSYVVWLQYTSHMMPRDYDLKPEDIWPVDKWPDPSDKEEESDEDAKP